MGSDYKKLIKRLKKDGWDFALTDKNHVRATAPDGQTTVIGSERSTDTADYHALKNIEHQLHRLYPVRRDPHGRPQTRTPKP
jgi:predicted RNA binding protein YcfA (HicA-like mRNA interferase family)